MKIDYPKHSGMIGTQVSQDHYFTKDYLSQARFLGLHAQFQACLDADNSNKFLELGPGPGLLSPLLKKFDCRVISLDFASDVRPDVVARLPEIPFQQNTFDIVCAFEVLEHLPFHLVAQSLKEMRRVASKRVIISVPDQQELHDSILTIRLKFGQREYHRVLWRKPLGRITNPHQHYWEVGFEGITDQIIIDMGKKEGLSLVSSYFVKPWFRFIIFAVC